MKVLLVNDDGIDCPMFHSLLRVCCETSWITDLVAVVPAFERSWVAGAITRDEMVSCFEREIFGTKVFVADGTPADCVSLALSGLLSFTPDLVISGLNAGMNTGVSFSHGSGTLAGAKFAALHGVPGIGFSMLVDSNIKNAWNLRDYDILKTYESQFDAINKYCLKASKAVLDAGLIIGENAVAHYCSFNCPTSIDINLAPVLTTPTNNRLLPMFKEVAPNTFKHKFAGFKEDFKEYLEHKPTLPDDMSMLHSGKVVYSFFRVDYDYGNLNLSTDCSERMLKAWSLL